MTTLSAETPPVMISNTAEPGYVGEEVRRPSQVVYSVPSERCEEMTKYSEIREKAREDWTHGYRTINIMLDNVE